MLAVGFLWSVTVALVSHHLGWTAANAGGLTTEQRRSGFLRALEVNPANGWAWWQLAKIELSAALEGEGVAAREHHLRQAEHAARQAVATLTRSWSYPLLAQVLYARSRDDAGARFAALEAYEKALILDPGDLTSINQATRVAIDNRDLDRARRLLRLADRVDINPRDPRPQNVDTMLLRAELAEIDGNPDEARRQCELALKIQPRSLLGIAQLARLLATHFDERERALDLLVKRWEPRLWEHEEDQRAWTGFVTLMLSLDLAARDQGLAFDVLRDIFERQIAQGRMAPDLRALVQDVFRRLVAQSPRGGNLDSTVYLRLHRMFTELMAEQPPDEVLHAFVEHFLAPMTEEGHDLGDRRILSVARSLLLSVQHFLDQPDPEVESLLGRLGATFAHG